MTHFLLPPLPVALPLLLAAVLVLLGKKPPRRLLDSICIAAAASIAVICVALLLHAAHDGPIVYWFGGWTPTKTGGFPVGISFVIDPIGAGLATLVSVLMLAAFVFSWAYFKSVGALFHALMLVFLAAMCGMCLTGDLFNLFVFFEIMTAAAVTLCGYLSEEYGPLQGALNLAITNSIGAFLSLGGIGLIYAQCGSLNLAEIGRSLAQSGPPHALLLVGFLFVVAGFLVKSAAVPFHFWLADAHAVAPTPVCILFSGVMVELGLYAIARVYWTTIAPAMPNGNAIRTMLLTVGTLTAIVGAIQCGCQRHLKRMLAFSTISHMGLMYCGVALLSAGGLAGTAMYVLGHGLIKGSLFACAGILLHRFQKVDEHELRGAGRQMPYTGAVLAIGGLALAGLPPFGIYYGSAMIEEAAKNHADWVPWLIVYVGAMTGGAVLRLAAHIFLGLGDKQPATGGDHAPLPPEKESGRNQSRTPPSMWAAAASLLALSLVVGWLPHLRHETLRAAEEFRLSGAYAAHVLDGQPMPHVTVAAVPRIPPMMHELIGVALAIVLALRALYPHWPNKTIGDAAVAIVHGINRPLRALHSGRVGDYVAWLIFGIAGYGALLLWKAS